MTPDQIEEAHQANVRAFQRDYDDILKITSAELYRRVLRLIINDFNRRQDGINAGRIEYF